MEFLTARCSEEIDDWSVSLEQDATVLPDKEGKPYSVRYDAVNAMLLNEFLKEHRKVEQMEKQIEALTAGLQKVSAQLESTKPAPQRVLNNHYGAIQESNAAHRRTAGSKR